jgi:DNA-binding GntR family transcriptional regulator
VTYPTTGTGRALYRKLADSLRADIGAAKYGPGAVIPSEAQLMKRFGVSRNTVRLAMEVLRDEGLVVTRHGCGTFVREDIVDLAASRDTTRPAGFA